MAKQTFVASTVLTAAQMNALQANDYNQTVSTKTASYTLVAADVGTKIVMNSASATTITVNTSLFSAGDTLTILNIGSGVSTVTAGTATVSTTGTLALVQNAGGTLYFTSAGVSVFQADGVAGGTKIGQVVSTNLASTFSSSATAYTDITGLSVSITPTLATSKVLVICSFNATLSGDISGHYQLLRGSTIINVGAAAGSRTQSSSAHYIGASQYLAGTFTWNFLDSPATTSSTTYKVQGFVNTGTFYINRGVGDADNANNDRTASNITVMEILI